jgi:hypothetical protein
MRLTVEIASVPDREALVAEIWDNDRMIAEINRERDDQLTLEFYGSKDGVAARVPLNEFVAAVIAAKERLSG